MTSGPQTLRRLTRTFGSNAGIRWDVKDAIKINKGFVEHGRPTTASNNRFAGFFYVKIRI